MTESDLLHNAIESLKTLAGSEQEIYLKRGEIISLLKTSKLYKGSFRRFLVESGICDILGKKPSCLEQNARVAEVFGPSIIKESLSIVPSRLTALLPIVGTHSDILGLVKECALCHIPDSAFKATLDTLKGKKDSPICDHINVKENKREQWIKHTCCGKWEQIG